MVALTFALGMIVYTGFFGRWRRRAEMVNVEAEARVAESEMTLLPAQVSPTATAARTPPMLVARCRR